MEPQNVGIYEMNKTGGTGKGTGMVKPEDMGLLQEKLFDTLKCFADFCDKYGIKYCLASGTCLGAGSRAFSMADLPQEKGQPSLIRGLPDDGADPSLESGRREPTLDSEFRPTG